MDSGRINSFLKSMKWRFYFSTLQIFLGYVLASWAEIKTIDFVMIVLLFVIFGPLLHGGIYTLNDVIDLKEDRKHPVKRKRPIPSGKISIKEAIIFSFALIGAALIFSLAIDFNLFLICILFLAMNLLYSFLFKKIAYVEILANAATHPLRFYTGVIAAGSFGFHRVALVLGLFAFGIATLKRKKELAESKEARAVLKFYTNAKLRNLIITSGLILLIITISATGFELYFGMLVLASYASLMVGYHKYNPINNLLNRWY
ncbi:MAG TPA: UbiA family prenyltransferase [Candidatus Nanoarchaeia archaeon]|nr:UbiA family prenyltransferase [Candidatus Nanoarchaeia archaeon]